ncbi:MAG: hypothetical protein OHK0056_20800 [Bacteriovoracaceae bacterium]
MIVKKCMKSLITLSMIAMAPQADAQQAKDLDGITRADISKLSKAMQIDFHEKVTELLVQSEKYETYPKYIPSKYSSIEILKFLNEGLISSSYANNSTQLCLFGGWPSLRSGTCNRPWSTNAKALAESKNLPQYDSSAYCGDEKLFRCNPLLFGPGLEDELAGSEFPELNGKKNNSAPFKAGICVDISSGYDGLSNKCQKASKRLDEIRVANGKPKWRSSDFFDAEVATKFKALQEVVMEKCGNDFANLNKDGMCSSLNESLSLSATAVLAGEINGISPDMLFTKCSVTSAVALPKCHQEVHNDMRPLVDALEDLRQQRNCRFQGIQAHMSDEANPTGLADLQNCRSVVLGNAAKDGFNGKDSLKFKFHFVGAGNNRLGNIEAEIRKDMSKDAIIALITTNQNRALFESQCNDSNCPKSGDQTLKALYEMLEKVKRIDYCRVGKVQAVDPQSADKLSSQCDLSIEGALLSEGLPYQANIRGPQTRIPASIVIHDVEGKPLSTIQINVASDMSSDDMFNQIDQQTLRKICVDANTAHRVDDTVAAHDLGISDTTFVPSFWKDKLNLLRNIAEREGIKGFRVEVSRTGDLELFADDPMDILRFQTQIENTLNLGRTDGGRVTFLNIGKKIIVSGGPGSTKVEAIANRNSITLTDIQRKLLVDVADNTHMLNFKVHADGSLELILAARDNSGDIFSVNEEIEGHIVKSSEKYEAVTALEAKRYVLVPKPSSVTPVETPRREMASPPDSSIDIPDFFAP